MTFQIGLVSTTLLCSLVAGFVWAFAAVAMPGLGTLDDREFLRAFQAVDRVIQNNQPWFLLVWVGSIVAILATGTAGLFRLHGGDRWLLTVAALVYLCGVQLPTISRNIPLNNQLQTLDLEAMDTPELATARQAFEAPWNRWNLLRTALATLTSVLLMVVVLRL